MSRFLQNSENICGNFDKEESEPADQSVGLLILRSTIYYSIQILRLVWVFIFFFHLKALLLNPLINSIEN